MERPKLPHELTHDHQMPQTQNLEVPANDNEILPVKNLEAANDNEILSQKKSNAVHLESLYEGLQKESSGLKKLHKDHEALDTLRENMGLPKLEAANDALEPPELQEMQAKIEDAEKAFLSVPEGKDGTQRTVENFLSSEEYKRLQKEMEASIEQARENFIEYATERILKDYKKEFDRAENGELAEELFKRKFPIYLRDNLVNSDTGVTYVSLRIKTLVGADGHEVTYIENVNIENREPTFIEKLSEKETNEVEKDTKSGFDESADASLIGKKEIEGAANLEAEKLDQAA